ncbi:MAG: nucleotidyltransferase domain-containing protein [Phycisphaerae bacterium]
MPHSNTPILPLGTQIVSHHEIKAPSGHPLHPIGAVGIIVSQPADHLHAYRIRFPDGFEASLKRQDFTTLRDFQSNTTHPNQLAQHNLTDHIIYRCIIGSRAYGLDTDSSDTDRRGIYLPPADLHWSLYGIPEQLENVPNQECYWELQKFLTLGLKANPNILECLYSPLVETLTPLGEELLHIRHAFLSKLVYQTYNGYVLSQFKKLQSDLRNKGEVKWKHVMHLLRLLLAGIETLKTGSVPVRVDQHRETLLSIKRGERTWEDLDAWRLQLHNEFDTAALTTQLPDRPDYETINAYLIHARRTMI